MFIYTKSINLAQEMHYSILKGDNFIITKGEITYENSVFLNRNGS